MTVKWPEKQEVWAPLGWQRKWRMEDKHSLRQENSRIWKRKQGQHKRVCSARKERRLLALGCLGHGAERHGTVLEHVFSGVMRELELYMQLQLTRLFLLFVFFKGGGSLFIMLYELALLSYQLFLPIFIKMLYQVNKQMFFIYLITFHCQNLESDLMSATLFSNSLQIRMVS